ncbi:HAD family hydrolase [Chloroflexota bacterium]
MRVKGVIFDLDGTLIDTIDTFTRSFNQGIGKFGLEPVPIEVTADFMNNGQTMEELLSRLFPGSFKKEDLDNFREEIKKAYLELEEDGVKLIPGAKEALQKLREMELKMGIVTARMSPKDVKRREIVRLGISQYIDAMVTGAEAERKPAPGSLLECINRLGLSPAECVMVGDSRVDVLTGRAASVMTIVIPNGVASRETLSGYNPDVMLDSLDDLPGYIGILV